MAKKSKKIKPVYDENGKWVDQHYVVKGRLRQGFRISPMFLETIKEARVELPPKTLKDGSVGKKNQVRYKCAVCGELFSQKNTSVDHISPVVPLYKTDLECSPNDLVEGIYCKKSNLQVICSTKKKDLAPGQLSCHSIKSNRENYIRDRLIENFQKNNVTNMEERVIIMNEKLEELSQQYQEHVNKKQLEELAKADRKKKRLEKLESKLKIKI